MSIKHAFQTTYPDGTDATLVRPSNWNADHDDTTSVLYHGAVGDGTTDDSAAFQAAIVAAGIAFVPAGTYYLATPVELRASGQGLRGEGRGLSNLKCATGAIKADDAQAAAIENCLIEGLYIYPSASAIHDHPGENGMDYADYTAIDLTGISYSTIRDVHTHQWQTHLNLGYSTYQTYYNHIDNFRSFGGVTGIYLGGDATNDGANVNTFLSCELKAHQIGIRVRGGTNTFHGTRIENPLVTTGYPATAIGIQFDSHYYAIGNTFVGTYCELAGLSGSKGIYFAYDTAATWVGPNTFIGGYWSVNGTYETPTVDASLADHIPSLTFNGSNLIATQNTVYGSDGVLCAHIYDNVGGRSVLKYTGVDAVTIAHETYDTAAPSTGTWIRGARVWNTEPSAGPGTYAGWVCVSAGTPGTWKGFGAIES